MIICVNCKKEMSIEHTGLVVRRGDAYVYPGDLWKCASCGFKIIKTNNSYIHDIDTIQMDRPTEEEKYIKVITQDKEKITIEPGGYYYYGCGKSYINDKSVPLECEDEGIMFKNTTNQTPIANENIIYKYLGRLEYMAIYKFIQ